MKYWITVVDDDSLNRMKAERILSFNGYKVNCLASGEELLSFLKESRKNRPDLILLDVHMTGIDGFETMNEIKKIKNARNIPVIFLTADDDADTEAKALSAGAMDFIVKPFIDTVMLLRVRHTIDLIRLEADLKSEVKRMSGEIIKEHERNERLSLQVVKTLAGAIDAKDNYTNGHSLRVAEYAREIARRAGYNDKALEEIYMMGLLHDVGKIGISDAVINKPSKLTPEEYAMIKTHPNVGSEILKNISDMPKLALVAKWHHERYDGKGYPDGLSGKSIPEEARIISVADAYDAMSSHRSYHDVFAQQYIIGEFTKGRGTQFDPDFTDIMLQMIAEDVEYQMREHSPTDSEVFGEIKSAKPAEADGERIFTFLSMLDTVGLNTAVGIKYSMNDPNFYKEMLSDFSVNAHDREALLNAYFTLREWDKYRNYVHSLKSSALSIGAEDLSEAARLMEEACIEGDTDYILNNHRELIDKMMTVVGNVLMTIAVYGGTDDRG